MKFAVSAPGKVILFGEHAALYNYPAIAVSIGLRCTVTAFVEKCKNDELILHFADIQDEPITVPLDLIATTPTILDCEAYAWNIVSCIFNHLDSKTLKENPVVLSTCVCVFLFLRVFNMKPKCYISIIINNNNNQYLDIGEKQRIILNIHSKIPFGAGLGSSGAFTVAMATTILYLTDFVQLNPQSKLDMAKCELISTLAKEAESIIHGQSSGLDPAISTYGGMILYQKDKLPSCQPLTCQLLKDNVQLLIVNTGIRRSTHTAVHHVSDQLASRTEFTRKILHHIGIVVNKAITIMESADYNFVFQSFRLLIEQNHQLLVQLGVSHCVIDEIVHDLNGQNISAKLTGAGFGGCLFGLLSTTNDGRVGEHTLSTLLGRLRERSGWAHIVSMFVDGVCLDLYDND